MAARTNRRFKALIAGTINPNYLEVIKTYTAGVGIELVQIGTNNGAIDLKDLQANLDNETSCVLIQTPNALGYLENMSEIDKIVHSNPKILFIAAVDPISLALINIPAGV